MVENVANTKIDFNIEKAKTAKLTDFAKSNCSLISLETNKNVLIKDIDKLWVTDSLVIIFDKRSDKVLVFNNSGKFIRQIGFRGIGPGEYTTITNVHFYPQSNEIELFDLAQMKLYCYKIDGKLVFEKKSKIYFTDFYRVKNGYWVSGAFRNGLNELYNLRYISTDLTKIEENYFPTQTNFDSDRFDSFITNSKGELFYNLGYSNTVYKLNNKTTITPWIRVDAGKYNIPYEELQGMTDKSEIEKNIYSGNNKYFGRMNIHITENSTFISIIKLSRTPESSYGIIVRKNSEPIIYDTFDSELEAIHVYFPAFVSEKKIVYITYPADLNDKQLELMQKRLNTTINVESNPILFIAHEK